MTVSKERIAVGIEALSLYDYNTSARKIVDDVFGDLDHHPHYLEEKVGYLVDRGILNFWGKLDGEHRLKLADAVRRRYGEEALGRTKPLI